MTPGNLSDVSKLGIQQKQVEMTSRYEQDLIFFAAKKMRHARINF